MLFYESEKNLTKVVNKVAIDFLNKITEFYLDVNKYTDEKTSIFVATIFLVIYINCSLNPRTITKNRIMSSIVKAISKFDEESYENVVKAIDIRKRFVHDFFVDINENKINDIVKEFSSKIS